MLQPKTSIDVRVREQLVRGTRKGELEKERRVRDRRMPFSEGDRRRGRITLWAARFGRAGSRGERTVKKNGARIAEEWESTTQDQRSSSEEVQQKKAKEPGKG